MVVAKANSVKPTLIAVIKYNMLSNVERKTCFGPTLWSTQKCTPDSPRSKNVF
jgi:hypothetical protein